MDEFRITASAVYSASFNPKPHQFFPTQEHVITSNDQYAPQDIFLLHFEEDNGGVLVDSSSTNGSITIQPQAALTNNSARFGSKSLSVPTVGKGAEALKLSGAGNDIDPSSDYTIEMYVKLNEGNNCLLYTSPSPRDS